MTLLSAGKEYVCMYIITLHTYSYLKFQKFLEFMSEINRCSYSFVFGEKCFIKLFLMNFICAASLF